MQARDWLQGVLEDAREERREFKANATRLDYVREYAKMIVAVAILYRVTAQMFAASLAGHHVPEDDVNWNVFGPPLDNVSPRFDFTARVGQAAFFGIAAHGTLPSFFGGVGIGALAGLNVGVLVLDPVLFAIDIID